MPPQIKENGAKYIAMASMCLVIAACSSGPDDEKLANRLKVKRPTVVAEKTEPTKGISLQTDETNSVKDAGVEYFDGSGTFTKTGKKLRRIKRDPRGGVALTFKNTDIRVVLRAVLKDTLKTDYTVDARVQGPVTLETSGNVSKEALWVIIEALLKAKNYAIVETSTGYHVLPVSDAPRQVGAVKTSRPLTSNLPGFGVQVVPLKYVSPTAIKEALEPFAPTGGILRIDEARHLIIIAGTSQELATMLKTIETFDVNWMAGMSFAMFTLQYVDPEQLANELSELFLGGEDAVKSNVKFIPIPRINKLLAVAPRRDILREIKTWIDRLDLGASVPGQRIYVYHVQNGRAADLAQTLNQILGTSFSGIGNNFNGGSFNQGNFGNQGQFGGNSALGNRNINGLRQQGFPNNGNQNRVSPLGGQANGFNSQGPRIVPSEENNSLMILATPSEFRVIEGALKQVDVAPRQVLIEVTLADIALTDELRYGLQWHFEFGENSVTFGSSTEPSAELPGFSWGFNNNADASAVLNALETFTDVNVISSPKLLVLNNESATLQVGDEVPVPSASAVSTAAGNAPIVNTIQYRNTGVILTVTPRINDGGLVMLDIEQEISNVVETASSGIDAPTIQQRRLTSSVSVQNGETIALGGLIRNSLSKTNSGVPFLKDIPLLGNAFKDTSITERRSELIILLTPRIINNVQETREVMDYLQNEFRIFTEDSLADD
jgi:general secretion pathway protein D